MVKTNKYKVSSLIISKFSSSLCVMFEFIFCLLEKCFFLGENEKEEKRKYFITEEEEIYIREQYKKLVVL